MLYCPRAFNLDYNNLIAAKKFYKSYKIRRNHLTDGASCVIIMNGTFYFWSLQSVQRRADKCCKVHILDKDCHQVPYQPK